MTTLKVLGAGPVKRGVTLVAADFEKRTGHKITVEFAGAPGVKDRILAGEVVDIAVVPRGTMNDFEKAGKTLAGARGLLGRSRIGMVVKKGAKLPDMSTVEAFKQTMLSADEIVCNVANSGNYVAELIGKMGVGQDKILKLGDTVKVMDHVAASTRNALGVGQLAEISELAEKGVAIVLAAPLPDAVQSETAYEAAVATASGAQAVAAEFVHALASDAGRKLLAATGID
ncbi:MAG TPA: substrate-binding domain-containing protein [Burkholderiales bacterium]|nr:substrate-binding domain-containing protein [Burkholderiales bacterium]